MVRSQRKTTIATTIERISTSTANRLTWLASQESLGGFWDARNAGTNSAGTASESCWGCECCLFSQSMHSVLPSDTGNPHEEHFCTRSIASGTEGAGAGSGAISTGAAEIAGSVEAVFSGAEAAIVGGSGDAIVSGIIGGEVNRSVEGAVISGLPGSAATSGVALGFPEGCASGVGLGGVEVGVGAIG